MKSNNNHQEQQKSSRKNEKKAQTISGAAWQIISNCLKGCPETYLWEPKPHSIDPAAEPYHGSRFICQTTRVVRRIIFYG